MSSPSEPGGGGPDPGLSVIMSERRALINIAYRLLGSLTEGPGGRPAAGADPADRITLDESVSVAFLVVLETMTPAERVVFILHDVFRHSFAEVAEITGRTPGGLPQAGVGGPPLRPRLAGSRGPGHRHGIVRAFRQAWEAGDIGALIGILDPEATVTADGGGLVSAALRPVEGAEQIARFYAGIIGIALNVTIVERMVNGQPGLVAHLDGVVTMFAFDIAGDRIKHIWAVRNPEKLRRWTTG